MSRKFFANRFAQTLPQHETDAASDRYIVPTPDRSPWTCLDRGWEEVADFALDWAVANAKVTNVSSIKAA
jgi:hypothetical protein